MYPAIDSALNWATKASQTPADSTSSSRFVFITDELSADGSFLLHHFIGRQLKHDDNSSQVFLVGLAQNQDHYLNVGKKLGYNLSTSTRAGRFQFYDVLSTSPSIPSHVINSAASQEYAKNVYRTIAEKLLSNRGADASCALIFDDISLLLYTGIAVKDVIWLVSACRSLATSLKGHLVVLSHADTTTQEDVEQTTLLRSLGHMADYLLEVRSLESGVTHGVTGQLSLVRGPVLDDPGFHPQLLHYSIGDSGVQFSAKGYSGGVL
ncbi:Elongator subunit elp6 [Rhizophlyctis rosea]|nr:Elongator subunit elp6 [Rhizophlyctis rosea]